MEDMPESGRLQHWAEARSTGPGDQEGVLSPRQTGGHLLLGSHMLWSCLTFSVQLLIPQAISQ